MITFVVQLMVYSRTLKGNGRLAWRKWRIRRSFRNEELPPGFAQVGSERYIVLPLVCISETFKIGHARLNVRGELIWDSTLPVVVYEFRVDPKDTKYGILGIACCPEYFDASTLQLRFQDAGFEISVDMPCHDQKPVALLETSPPVVES